MPDSFDAALCYICGGELNPHNDAACEAEYNDDDDLPEADARSLSFLVIDSPTTYREATGGELLDANDDPDVREFVLSAYVGQSMQFGGGAAPVVRLVRIDPTASKENAQSCNVCGTVPRYHEQDLCDAIAADHREREHSGDEPGTTSELCADPVDGAGA